MAHLDVPARDPARDYRMDLWVREECFRHYVRKRRALCTHLQILDLTLYAPCCEDCIQNEPWVPSYPDLSPDSWQSDLLLSVSVGALDRAKAARRRYRDFAWPCKGCGRGLRPWRGDDVYVLSYHLEENYGIPLTTPGRRHVSRKVRDQIFKLYDFRCFNCPTEGVERLHLDHIRPQSRGGDAAFRNLQPLCERCGQEKGDTEPEELPIADDLYFHNPPSDSYEGLFW